MSSPDPSWPTPAAPPARRGIPVLRTVALALLVFGTIVTVIGTFVPWLRSGETTRNSFQVAGATDRFGLLDNPALRAIVENWALVGPVLMVPLICAGLRWWRGGAVAALVIGLALTALTATVMIAIGDLRILSVEMVATGPVTVIAGAVLILLSGVLLLASTRRDLPASR